MVGNADDLLSCGLSVIQRGAELALATLSALNAVTRY